MASATSFIPSTTQVSTAAPLRPDMDPCIGSGDSAWMLISTVLVLVMFPGVAFFEAGLLRRQNTTSIFAQVFCGLSLLSTLWVLFGFSITLGPNSHAGFIGDFTSNPVFWDLSLSPPCSQDPNSKDDIPRAIYAIFQMMFACITPLLMTGAYAERLLFYPFVIFTVCWEIIVYYFVAHWMWHPSGWLNQMGAQDFAGGIVIHTTAGMSSLVAVWILGHRKGFDKYHGEFPYSNLPLACIGATLLWAGWFGFNGGSALSSGRVAVAAVVNSQVGASAASVVYMLIVLWQTGRPSTIAMINGAIGGLAGVTPAAGYITPPSAMLLGAILGVTVWAGIHLLKHRLRFDDALDVSSVHGLTGIVGALYIGFAGKASVSGANGAVEAHGQRDGWRLLGVQLLAVIVCGAWAAAWTFILLKAIGRFMPLRIPDDEEHNGLDVYLHNEGVEARESFASVANIAAIAAAAGVPPAVALRASMGGIGADYGAINRTSAYHAPPAAGSGASVTGSAVGSNLLGRTARSMPRFDVAAEDGLRMSEEADMVATLIRAASHQFDSHEA